MFGQQFFFANTGTTVFDTGQSFPLFGVPCPVVCEAQSDKCCDQSVAMGKLGPDK